jgi:hypothetical protein
MHVGSRLAILSKGCLGGDQEDGAVNLGLDVLRRRCATAQTPLREYLGGAASGHLCEQADSMFGRLRER